MTYIENSSVKATTKLYKHLFFDLDRTLWDFEKNAILALEHIYNKYSKLGYIGDFERFMVVYRYVNEDLWEKYRDGEISKDQLITDRFHHTFCEFGFNNLQLATEAGVLYLELSPQQTGLFPRALEVVHALSRKYRIHILTNGFRNVQREKLRNSGLEPFVDQLITSEDGQAQKPDIRIFEYALQLVGASESECLMIGDDLRADIAGAKNAKIDYVWFNPENRKADVDSAQQINSLAELLHIL